MKAFRFELEALLRARRAEERKQQLAVAAIERERVALENELRRQQATIDAGRERLREDLVGTLDTAVLRSGSSATLHAMRSGQRTAQTLAALHQRLGAARHVLGEAAARRRALETLRETRLAEWRRDVERAATRELDDIASSRRGSAS